MVCVVAHQDKEKNNVIGSRWFLRYLIGTAVICTTPVNKKRDYNLAAGVCFFTIVLSTV